MDKIVLSLLGTQLDSGQGPGRWEKWRPTVALCQHDDLLVHRLHLVHARSHEALAKRVEDDIDTVSPETKVVRQVVEMDHPWDFEEVYAALHDVSRAFTFDEETEELLVHITTGTHVAQICLFLLTEARYLPGKLVQTSPPRPQKAGSPGSYEVIDLDLSRYDRIASRFRREQREGLSFLKSGIDTRNAAFNRLIERIERVAVASKAPLLLTGPTGAGKSQLARRIYELKKARRQIAGDFVEVNAATLRGDAAMSTLFGHVRGAFTGAERERPGLLRAADGGALFLDEIGELGLDEQAMLLRAVEEKRFLPVGADKERESDFQLMAGTNRDLLRAVRDGRFREDLLARINLWTFALPGLADRPEDLAPNLEYELSRIAAKNGVHVTMSREARERFLQFGRSKAATWRANFRDFSAAVTRMATLAHGGRIGSDLVEEEISRLKELWQAPSDGTGSDPVEDVLGSAGAAALDRFDRVQLADVIRVCREARSLSAAGRTLFAASRESKTMPNDADRLRKYLLRFRLSFADVSSSKPS